MRNISIIFKNGYILAFRCEHMEVRTIDGELSGYTFKGAQPPIPMFIQLDEIVAVVDEGEVEGYLMADNAKCERVEN